MARWTGTWLQGPGAVGARPPVADDALPGVRLGLPAEGAGSSASFGARAGAFAIDAVLCGLVARLFFPVDASAGAQTSTGLAPVVVLAVLYLVGVTLTGQTVGMRLVRLRVLPLTAAGAVGEGRRAVPGVVPVALRTALLLLLVPALVSDRDGRGLHDRAAGTVVVRT
jgi:uncharacterized RDD family membrane protein YckC